MERGKEGERKRKERERERKIQGEFLKLLQSSRAESAAREGQSWEQQQENLCPNWSLSHFLWEQTIPWILSQH